MLREDLIGLLLGELRAELEKVKAVIAALEALETRRRAGYGLEDGHVS